MPTAAYQRSWASRHPTRAKEYNRRCIAKDPERYRSRRWIAALRTVYGLTLDQFHALFEKQGEKCAICPTVIQPRAGRGGTTAYIDHDHRTGKVRGLLCLQCNQMLGMAHEDPEVLRRGAAYLERTKESR